MVNSHMNSANKVICYAEVINMDSLCELLNSTPVYNTLQWYIQCRRGERVRTIFAISLLMHAWWCGDMSWEAHWLVVQHNNAQ